MENTTETTVDKRELNKLLGKGVVSVTFTKQNGKKRVMKCTLVEDKIPPSKRPTTQRKRSDALATVYDLERKEWRSFHYDSVSKFAAVG